MVKNMAWLRNEKQLSTQTGEPAGVTPLIFGSRESALVLAPSPVRSLIVPGTAILIALTAILAAGANWDSWIASRAIQSTDDAAIFADVSAISTRVGGTVEAI